jgi:gliding motility-associated-like protein
MAQGLLKNSSPVFSQEDTALVCTSSGFTFPFKAKDPDGDSLVYRFTAGLNTPNRDAKPDPPNKPPFPNLVYAGNFDADRPLGTAVTINPNTGIISGVAPAEAGDYVVAVLVEEYRLGIKIAETRKELHLAVGNCTIPKAMLPPNITNCNNFDVTFENQSVSPGINSYFWDFGVTNSKTDTSSAPRPLFTYADTGVYTARLIVNPGGICPDSVTTEVRIFPGFNVDFSIKGVCQELPYQFIDLSKTTYGVINKWKWNFGDLSTNADTSNLKTPFYNYNNIEKYQVKLIAGSSKGCIDSTIKELDVVAKPHIQLASRDTLICKSDSVQLQAIGPGNYSWSPAVNMINPNSAAPLVFPKRTTTYYVSLNNENCIGTDSVKVNVTDFITVNAGNDTTICRGDALQLNPVSQAIQFQWSPSATMNDASLRNPLATINIPVITYTVQASLGSCKASDAITISTQPYPTMNAGNDTTICFGTTALLHGSSNATQIAWQPSDHVENNKSLATKAFPPGSQTFILAGNFTSGCTKPIRDSVFVKVLPRINVFAGNDTSIVYGQPLQLNAITNADIYSWNPSTHLNNPQILNPIFFVPQDASIGSPDYLRYTLSAHVNEGCSATDEIVIRLFKSPSIFVPSGFTPNSDGLNDVIRPLLAGMKQLEYFRVYNRYGSLIFQTTTPGVGWNGTVKGQLQSSGAFVYECRAIDYTGNKIISKGNFVLVR